MAWQKQRTDGAAGCTIPIHVRMVCFLFYDIPITAMKPDNGYEHYCYYY